MSLLLSLAPLPAWVWTVAGIGTIFVLIYACYLVVNTLRFSTLRPWPLLPDDALPTVCVLIPARNEEAHIGTCLQAILAQNYPANKLEVIIIDDHSTDATADIVRQRLAHYRGPHRAHLLQLTGPESNAMKKAALAAGIAQTDAQVIVCTDADSAPVSKLWVKTLASGFDAPEVGVVAGPVRMRTHGPSWRPGWFTDFQAFESGGLVLVAAGNIAGGSPMMVNGANLAYRRDAYLQVSGFDGLTHVASGDDELLVHRLVRQGGYRVRFARSPLAFVDTEPCHTWADFRRQRIRWVSKARAYRHPVMTFMQGSAYIAKLFVAIALLSLPLIPSLTTPYLTAIVTLHALPELLALGTAAAWMGRPRLIGWFPIIFWVYILYVLWVGAVTPFVKQYNWKGRQVS